LNTVLYLRHKLQKGFLSRDQAPKEEEMQAMSEHMTQLETYEDLEASIIKETKINKVLKAIQRLPSIPREEDFTFKKRSTILLECWNKALTINGDAAIKPTSNGVANGDKPSPEENPAEEKVEEAPAPAPVPTEVKGAAKDGDVAMEDAPVSEEPAAIPAADTPIPA
jgi:hypothetical protein